MNTVPSRESQRESRVLLEILVWKIKLKINNKKYLNDLTLFKKVIESFPWMARKLNSSLTELINLSSLCNLQLFASSIEENIRHWKLLNYWVAKGLMSHTFFVKCQIFQREFLRNHSIYRAQIFKDIWNWYALLIFMA